MCERVKPNGVAANIDGTPVEMAGDPVQFTVTHREGEKIVLNITAAERARIAAEVLAEVAQLLSAMLEAAVAAITTFWEKYQTAVEFRKALRWAEAANRPLAVPYHRTKKKRVRKKYAKRILAWYREEVLGPWRD